MPCRASPAATTALCTLGGTLASLAAGIWLDLARASEAAGSGIATTILMRRQHQPTPEGGRAPFHPRLAVEPWADPDARRIIWFQLGWNGAIGLSSAFFAVHLPLALSPRQNRQFYVATFASAGGLAFAASAALGGVIVGALPAERFAFGHHWYATHAVFALSALARFFTAFLSLRIRDPSGRPVPEVGRMILEAAREAQERVRALWLPAPEPQAAAAPATEGRRPSGASA